MAVSKIRIQHTQAQQIAKTFAHEAQSVKQTNQNIKGRLETLSGGDWKGESATHFYAEMNSRVLPALTRLAKALDEASQIMTKMAAILKQAEDETAAIFKAAGAKGTIRGSIAGAGAALSGSANIGTSGGFLSKAGKVLGFVGDLFVGAGSELVDMVKGVGSAIAHPIQTIKGIGYAITHPGELWDAFKKPYVEDWNNGHPGRAIGRGLLFAASFLVGAGEAKAGAEAGKVGELADAARVMRSSNELMGVEKASQGLLDAVAKRRTVVIAQEGSEEMRFLDYFGAEASVGGETMEHIILRPNPSKAAVLEEFLHGTQKRLGIIDELGMAGLGSAETHVKDFMIRHRRLLGLGDEDVAILKILKDKGL